MSGTMSFEDFAGTGGTPAAASQPAPVPFEDFASRQASAVPAGKQSGYVANVGAGTSEAVAGYLGLLPDVAAGAINLIPRAINYAAGTNIPPIQNPIGGSEWWKHQFGYIGANPEDVVPATAGEEAARAASRGVTNVALPGGIAKMLPEAKGAAETVRQTLAAGAAPTVAGVAGASSIAGQFVADVVPPEYAGVADSATQLVTSGLMLGAPALVRGGVNAVRGAVRGATGPASFQAPEEIVNPATGQPFTAVGTTEGVGVGGGAGQPISATPKVQQAAAERVASRLGMAPEGAASWAPTEEPPVPGSQLSVGQMSGNLSALNYERLLRDKKYGREAFTQQEAQRNLNQTAALKDIAPADASQAASDWFRSLLQTERQQNEAAVGTAQMVAQSALERAGVSPELPGTQEIGAGQRTALEAQRQPVKDALNRGYKTIDPDGTLALDTTPVKDRAQAIQAELGKGGELTSAETRVMNAAADMGGVNKFSDLRSLQSSIAEKLREVVRDPKYGAESPPYRRLAMLMDSVQQSITEAAGRAAGDDIASGTAQGQRIVDRLSGIPGEPATGEQVAPSAAPAQPTTVGRSLEQDARAWMDAKGKGQTEQAPFENFSPDDAANIRSLNRRYAEYKDTFRRGAVGEVLATGQGPGGYRIGEAMVPARLFRPGPAGAEAADSLIRAAGGVTQAQQLLGEYPALAFRNAAMKNGAVDPTAFERFTSSRPSGYGPALAKFPELASRFRSAGDAQQAVTEAAARGQARIEDIQNSAARVYLGKGDIGVEPQQAIADLLKTKNPAAEARDLMRRAAPNDAAIDGIRRNFVEHLLTRATTTAEAGTTGEKALSGAIFQRLIADPKVSATMDVIMTPEGAARIRAVAKEMELGARAYNAVKIPGSPASAADKQALESHGGPSQFMVAYLSERAGELSSHLIGIASPRLRSLVEAASTVGGMWTSARRASALEETGKLETEMMLNPALFRVMMQKAATNARAPAVRKTAAKIMQLTMSAGLSGQAQANRQ